MDDQPLFTGRRITRRSAVRGLTLAIVSIAVAGCHGPRREEHAVTSPTLPSPTGPSPTGPSPPIDLPTPTGSTFSLDTALRHRRSVREFGDGALTTAEIGRLLWSAQGVTADWGGRTTPSAGALYPLELYAATASGAMRYLPDGHRVEPTTERDLRPDLQAAALDQEVVGSAPLVVAVVGVPARTASKYGDRAPRYVDLEAGHAAQNLLLQAVAIGLVAVPVGAFDDEAVRGVLELPADQEPRYLLPVGRPRD